MSNGARDSLETVRLTAGAGSASSALVVRVFHLAGTAEASLPSSGAVVIGRAAPSDVVVEDPSLSRVHARIATEGDRVFVEDLASTNGTLLDGVRLEERTELTIGVPLQLGSATAVVQHAAAGPASLRSTLTHDRFVGRLAEEIARAKAASGGPRALSVLMLRPIKRGQSVLGMLPKVTERLAPYQKVALYSREQLEVLAPECDRDGAKALLEELRSGTDLTGVMAVFPTAGNDAEALLSALLDGMREEGRAASGAHPVEDDAPPAQGIVVKSPRMQRLFSMIDRLSKSAIPVLIQGETGTGKEVVARAVHEASTRSDKPFLSINCAAIPASLVEATLFGHEKGAFTGANERKAGTFEAADTGTVFLDELGELPAPAQAALLRVLESGAFQRVGATEETAVDVRIVAATHRPLAKMVEEGTFREDLLFRLNAMTLEVPPLRERSEEILPLAHSFLAAASEQVDRAITLDEDVERLLEAYHWPGNVRELKNAMVRAAAIAEGDRVEIGDLPEVIQRLGDSGAMAALTTAPAPAGLPVSAEGAPMGEASEGPTDFRSLVNAYERSLIKGALEATSWNKAHAARRLHMPIRTLSHKCTVFGLKRPD